MVRIFVAFVVFVLPLRAETLTIATYNVENYGIADRMTEDGFRKEYPKPESEKRALRTVIKNLNADVLVLQEMGPAPYFAELRRNLKADGVDYAYGFLLEGSDADRHVAVLSRRPFEAIVPRVGLTFPYFGKLEFVKRGMVEVTLRTSAGDVTLFCVHLKSRFTDRPDDPMSALRRVGEATAVRDEILRKFSEPQNERFIILGDFNDGRTSKPLQRLMHRGTTEISKLLPAADPRGETWTHCYKKEDTYSRVDHVLVSPQLRESVQGGRAVIVDGPDVMQASDHRPVIVTIDLSPP